MRILVTGGSGFFGMAFTRRMVKEGHTVCVYSRNEFAQHQMRMSMIKEVDRLRFFIGDVRDYPRLAHAMRGVDIVVHAAALKRIEVGAYNPEEMAKTNVFGTANVIRAAQETNVRKVVFLSSDKAHMAVSAYGQSKALAESLVLAANDTSGHVGPHFNVVRYGNVANSTGSVIPIWRKLIDDGARSVPVSDPDVTRFWMREREAVDLVYAALKAEPGQYLHIPTWLPAYRLGDLADAMGAEMEIYGLGDYEKKHESMCDGCSSDTAPRLSVEEIKERLSEL